jgi:hypothetical protein
MRQQTMIGARISAELQRCAGTQFDRAVVGTLVAVPQADGTRAAASVA